MEITVKRNSSLANNTEKPHLCSVSPSLVTNCQAIDSLLSEEKRTVFPSLSIKIKLLEKSAISVLTTLRMSCASWPQKYTPLPIQKNATCLLRIPLLNGLPTLSYQKASPLERRFVAGWCSRSSVCVCHNATQWCDEQIRRNASLLINRIHITRVP